MNQEKHKGGRPAGSIDYRNRINNQLRLLEKALAEELTDGDVKTIAQKIIKNAREGNIEAVNFLQAFRKRPGRKT